MCVSVAGLVYSLIHSSKIMVRSAFYLLTGNENAFDTNEYNFEMHNVKV